MLHRRTFLASTAAATASSFQLPRMWGRPDEVPTSGVRNPKLAAFDRLFEKFLKDNAVPGASVAVSRAGKLVYARGFGFADRDSKEHVQPTSLFRLASISKPITAVGIMMLKERGKLKLEDPVLKHIHLKPFAHTNLAADPRWEKITVLQCLQHTGGWNREKKGGYDPIGIPWKIEKEMGLKHAPKPDDIVRYTMGLPLDFDPGARMVYSNLGYLVLGRVLENATGEKYETWIEKQVLAPIRANSFSLGRALPENRPTAEVHYYHSKGEKGPCLYPPREGEKVPLPDGAENLEGFEAHGGWIASAVDLVRFACAFDYGKKSPLLSQKAIEEMWARPQGLAGFDRQNKPRERYYGCGWEVYPVGSTGKANVWHSGFIAGTSTLLVRRNDGLNWAVLFNTDSNERGEALSNPIDPLMHKTADAIEKWPEVDLFDSFAPAGR